MTKPLNQWTLKELLSLPVRTWDKPSAYDSLLILPTDEKHDSGWRIMAIIGTLDFQPVEIASRCDDIEWKLPDMEVYKGYTTGQMRMDCAFRSGAIHAWKRGSIFRVGIALSSTTIEVFEAAIRQMKGEI